MYQLGLEIEMSRKKTYTFPVVAWDDIEGKDVWVADVIGSIDEPLAARYENEEFLANLENEVGQCFVVRTVEG